MLASKQIVDLPNGYKPTEKEKYMNPNQLEYFRRKLVTWKEELQIELRKTLDHLKEKDYVEPDPNDIATDEMEKFLELRSTDRYTKLIDKIDAALQRIESKEYGYCEETGDEIGIKRLEARPIATLSIEAQEKHESYEKQHSEDE